MPRVGFSGPGPASGSALGPFPAATVLADHEALPTTTRIGAVMQGYDRGNNDVDMVSMARGDGVTIAFGAPAYVPHHWNSASSFHPMIGMGAVDGAAATAAGAFGQAMFDGSAMRSLRTGSALVLSGTTQDRSQLVTRPGDWTVVSTPAANTQASASKAAGAAGVRHVCTWVMADLVAAAALGGAAYVLVHLRDGATGAGTILASWRVAVPTTAGSYDRVFLGGLNIPGSTATAMTLEFAAAAGADTLETVSFGGYSV